MKPRNKESKELDELTRQILEIPPTTTAEGYKTKAIELSQRYASYS
jgi:hypothetical protein